MVSKIINLTRKVLPKLSTNSKQNIESINSMPEMVLARMRNSGNKNILYVDMNHCAAAIIKKEGINTVYTDALNGCNSVGAAIKLKNGEPLFLLSHYVPTNIQGQIKALSKQLETYKPYFDNTQEAKLFLNIRGYKPNGDNLEVVPNSIIDEVKKLFSSFFTKKPQMNITPYQNQNRPAFFSSANIFQFDTQDLNKVKITNVGEKESFINLNA